jgi:ZIP family zinc transporter
VADAGAVFGYALLTAVATGLGAVPFVGVRSVSKAGLGWANALASGLMLGASFGLVAEGTHRGAWQTVAGAAAGVLFILLTQRVLARYQMAWATGAEAGARRMALMMIVMTVHSFAEGIAVGVAFGGGVSLAAAITIAVAVHNVPEGLAISAVLYPRGVGVAGCAAWSVVSSLPQPLMAVPAFLLVEAVAPALPYGIGFAAGAMGFMVLVELLPEAYDQARRAGVALAVCLTLVGMVVLQQYLGR